jgi:hypothetical protein
MTFRACGAHKHSFIFAKYVRSTYFAKMNKKGASTAGARTPGKIATCEIALPNDPGFEQPSLASLDG